MAGIISLTRCWASAAPSFAAWRASAMASAAVRSGSADRVSMWSWPRPTSEVSPSGGDDRNRGRWTSGSRGGAARADSPGIVLISYYTSADRG